MCVLHFTLLPGNAGKIVSEIKRAGFEVSALQMFNLDRANAEEFLEIYKGVLQEYKGTRAMSDTEVPWVTSY